MRETRSIEHITYSQWATSYISYMCSQARLCAFVSFPFCGFQPRPPFYFSSFSFRFFSFLNSRAFSLLHHEFGIFIFLLESNVSATRRIELLEYESNIRINYQRWCIIIINYELTNIKYLRLFTFSSETVLNLCKIWPPRFSSNLYVLRPPEWEKMVFGMVSVCPSVCLHDNFWKNWSIGLAFGILFQCQKLKVKFFSQPFLNGSGFIHQKRF